MAKNPSGCNPPEVACCDLQVPVLTVRFQNHHGCDFTDTKIYWTGSDWQGTWSGSGYTMNLKLECILSTLDWKLSISGCAGDQSHTTTPAVCTRTSFSADFASGWDFTDYVCGCSLHGDSDITVDSNPF